MGAASREHRAAAEAVIEAAADRQDLQDLVASIDAAGKRGAYALAAFIEGLAPGNELVSALLRAWCPAQTHELMRACRAHGQARRTGQ